MPEPAPNFKHQASCWPDRTTAIAIKQTVPHRRVEQVETLRLKDASGAPWASFRCGRSSHVGNRIAFVGQAAAGPKFGRSLLISCMLFFFN
jgi:hypothetical protein